MVRRAHTAERVEPTESTNQRTVGEDWLVPVTFTVPASLRRQLKETSRARGVSQAKLIVTVLQRGLAEG